MIKKKNKRAQVTIFIIIAIVIVLVGILIYLFYPSLDFFQGETESPKIYMQQCLEKDLQEKIELISIQGGSLEPENYYVYKGNNIEYLCYTVQDYSFCVMQQPMLKKHLEEEIQKATLQKVNSCWQEMKNSFESRGYGVQYNPGSYEIELLPNRIVGSFEGASVVLQKQETQEYDSFSIVLNNNLYELMSIANSILNSEARFGDSDPVVYMSYYRNLKVEKHKQTDGTTIYVLTNRDTEDKFQFASRSVAIPGGY